MQIHMDTSYVYACLTLTITGVVRDEHGLEIGTCTINVEFAAISGGGQKE
jgi:hypothetical protein